MDGATVSLVDVHEGEQVCVVDILGGCGLASRLEALGIRPGTNIIKRSEMFMKGPVTVVSITSSVTSPFISFIVSSNILQYKSYPTTDI